jgi:hypothetical protein
VAHEKPDKPGVTLDKLGGISDKLGGTVDKLGGISDKLRGSQITPKPHFLFKIAENEEKYAYIP